MRIESIERQGDVYVARDASGETVWTVELRLDMAGTPFREEAIWPAASVVVIAGGPDVHFVSESGQIVKTLSLGRDLFGHLGPTDHQVLHILGWRNVTAIDKALEIRWVSRNVAVDGIEGSGRIQLAAEMDPPGGWVDVELDANTGREIRRAQTIVGYGKDASDNMSIVLGMGTVGELVELIIGRGLAGVAHDQTLSEIQTRFGISSEDAALAMDRTYVGIVRAATESPNNRPDPDADPIAYESYERARSDQRILQLARWSPTFGRSKLDERSYPRNSRAPQTRSPKLRLGCG